MGGILLILGLRNTLLLLCDIVMVVRYDPDSVCVGEVTDVVQVLLAYLFSSVVTACRKGLCYVDLLPLKIQSSHFHDFPKIKKM